MYFVEELPDATSSITPGWAYVTDRGLDPSQAAAASSSLSRKRTVRDPAGGGGGGSGGGSARGDLSSRQRNAINRHLTELDRENHRDVSIPAKGRDGRGKMKSTVNVRRILASQKTFRNFLDDEEAALVQQQHQQQQLSSSKAATLKSMKSKPSQSHTPARQHQLQQLLLPAKKALPKLSDSPDTHPLLRSYTPSAPSDRIMQALLAEPPLSYNAARAGPPSTQRPQRYFCVMCGHWGRIRCRNCHVRTCGLECFRLHEDSRCGAFF